MNVIQEAVRAYLKKASGVNTVCDRTRVRGEYPLLAVAVKEDGTVLMDGGRQAQHTYQVTVTAVNDRDRDGNTALLASLTVPLLRGIPMVDGSGESRTLHPLDIRTEGEELTFSLTLCVPVPPLPKPGQTEPGVMETLHMGF